MAKWKKKIGYVHIQDGNTTVCGIPMLGNNYADNNMPVDCPKCNDLRLKQIQNGNK